VIAFARTGTDGPSITVASRFPRTLAGDRAPVGKAIWGDTGIPLPFPGVTRWACSLGGHVVEAFADGTLGVGDVLAHLPVSLLFPAGDA
jgi:maltooligosyltrehalose synthase